MEKNCFVANVMSQVKVASQMNVNTSKGHLYKDKPMQSSTEQKQDRLLEVLNVRSSK